MGNFTGEQRDRDIQNRDWKITSIAPLGAKNYNLPGNGIDASDRDLTATTGKINIQNQPAFGLYQPDAIASFSIAGKAYYITANEGDSRDYTGFSEESRVEAAGYVLVNPAAGRVTNPFIKEFSIATGQEIRSLTVPTKFLPKVQDTNNNGIIDAADTQTAGVRNNAAFESLTIDPDRRTLYTATENSLFQDGTIATPTIDSLASLTPAQLNALQPVQKWLLLNLDALELPTGLDNIEGLAFGAKLADGRQSIIDFGGKTLAILTGIQATSLSTSNASQFMFV